MKVMTRNDMWISDRIDIQPFINEIVARHTRIRCFILEFYDTIDNPADINIFTTDDYEVFINPEGDILSNGIYFGDSQVIPNDSDYITSVLGIDYSDLYMRNKVFVDKANINLNNIMQDIEKILKTKFYKYCTIWRVEPYKMGVITTKNLQYR